MLVAIRIYVQFTACFSCPPLSLSAPVLTLPVLLGTAWAQEVEGSEQLAALLAAGHRVRDLEPVFGRSDATRRPLRLQVAMAALGDVTITSVLGDPLTLEVDPRQQTCLLALPSMGWGQYRLEGSVLDNRLGQSVAFLPASSWRLTNDVTAGTALQFTQEAVLNRIQAMAGVTVGASALRQLLSHPFVIDMQEPRHAYAYHHLLAALAMVDGSFRFGGQPDPMLCLDDLILRCIALLLHPTLMEMGARQDGPVDQSTLRRSVLELMDWMRSNLHRPISLSEIEQRVGYGRRAIQLGFKAEVGCGPMQWLRRQRLALAHEKLLAGGSGLTVTQVSRACGYINLASFSRDFREQFGCGARDVLVEARRRDCAC